MANVENIVKIMNFHSLLRVDKAKRKAEKYFAVEKELTTMISQILYNRNLNIDLKILDEADNGVTLNFYLGNDLGFCGNFNSLVRKQAEENTNVQKVIIGKKIFLDSKDVILNISKEDFYQDFTPIEEIIYPLIKTKRLKELNVIYNHYYNVNDIRLEVKRIFPTDNAKEEVDTDTDFVIETDVNQVLTQLILIYLCYQLKILEANSWASENVMRERTTRESLTKIEEIEEEKEKEARKERKYQAFKKQISNYRRVGEQDGDR